MKRSTDRILTTQAGSLPRPDDLIALNLAKLSGNRFDEKAYTDRLASAGREGWRRSAGGRSTSVPTSSRTASSARRRAVRSITAHGRATRGGGLPDGSTDRRATCRRLSAAATGLGSPLSTAS